ncbi:hypothetical protein BD311DRAFT_597522, partial [Dichomitus squalens]
GHINFARAYEIAQRLRREGTPVDLSEPPFECQHCILGKQTRSSVPKRREGERSTEVGGLIYIDGIGTESTMSATRNLYALDLLDDYSSYAWTYPCQTKSAMAVILRHWVIA